MGAFPMQTRRDSAEPVAVDLTPAQAEAEIRTAAELGVFYTLLHYFAEDSPSAAIRETAQALRSALCVLNPAAPPLPSLPWWSCSQG